MAGDIQIRQLEYLVALAREQHFARAATACHASQPALSTAIRKLEVQLGVTIVQRGQRFSGFTPEGQRVVGWAHRILAERDGLREDLSRMRQGLVATLRIGAIPTAVPVTALLTTPFSDKHPLATVRIEVLSSREIVRKLADFELDAGLTYLSPASPTGTRSVGLYQERYLLLTPSDGEFGARDSVTWAEAASQPMCALGTNMQNRRILDAAVAAAGGAQMDPVLETDTVDAIYAHVATRRWSAIIAHTWLHAFGLPAGTSAVPLTEPSPHPTVGLLISDHEPPPIAASALLEAVTDTDVPTALNHSVQQALARA
ncbi:LysR family transcriptional regulator [Pseudonocardia spinosispora]|uniref:LysR family transcriptional regulator n=1 Tax=Pseudonocardia spinosispora TaxID=103441 RepID=UPI0003FD5E11|nr:LysR family transcriptional regulator [Pseudonocardia spinosispora]